MKAAFLLFLVCVVTPAAGFLMRYRTRWQKITLFLMCFMVTSGFFRAAEWGFTIHPVLFRGTARGFHFYWAEFAALTLIWARMFGQWSQFRFFPPGLWFYLLYCAACLISLLNAPGPMYSMFAAVKAIKIIVIFLAVYNFLESEEDLRFLLTCLSITMFWQLFVVLKQKYVDHIYQVYGTFEHQNSLCMFTILIAMVFLAVALGPKGRRSGLFLLTFVGCAAIVQSTLSRGGLAVFAAGTIGVVVLSLIDKPTKRRLAILASLIVVGVVGLVLTLDTIVNRFRDYGTQESANTRRMLNVSARMILRDYTLGVGWNNFGVVINKPFHYGDHIDYWQRINGNPGDPHYKKGISESLYWLLLSETGYQGFLTYMLLVFVFLFWNLRLMIHYRRHFLGTVCMGIFVGLFSNYMQSFLERVLTQPRQLMLWLILLAVTARIETWRREDQKRRLQRPAERLPQSESPDYDQELQAA